MIERIRRRLSGVLAFAAALLGLFAAPLDLSAQQRGTITGRVTDEAGAPLSTVQVTIPSLSVGTLSGNGGEFRLENVPAGSHVVSAQRLGYGTVTQPVEVGAGQTATANFALSLSALALDEIVVTGTAGGTERRAIGNVVGRVDAAAIAEVSPVNSVRDVIGTREPGASVMGGAGTPGAGSVIRIRGSSSLSLDNSPLIYVDGVRVDGGQRSGGYASQGMSRLDDFSPEDIESIEIIKGPAAASLYGTEAANGVIQIITKRGRPGTVAFDMSLMAGTNWFPNPQRYFADKWYRMPQTGELVSANLYELWEEQTGEPYAKYGSNLAYHLGARGGTDLVRFAASVDIDRDSGAFKDFNQYHDRNSGRLNLDFLAREDLSVSGSVAYSQREHADPEFASNRGPIDVMFFGTHPLHAPERQGFRNSPDVIRDIFQLTEARRFTASANLVHTPTEWFTHRLTLGQDENSDHVRVLYPRHPLGANGPLGGQSAGQRADNYLDLDTYSVDYSASANASLTSSIETTTSVGVQYYDRRTQTRNLQAFVFPAPGLTDPSAASGGSEASGTFIQNKTLGAYIEERVGIGDDLFITGALRADDNSAFGANYDLALYPKLSAAWTFEDPLSGASWLDVVRLRSAFGVAGQQPDVFAAVRFYDPVPGPDNQAAISPGAFGNPDLKPERSQELEVGFDASLFDGRTELEVTYYTRKTKDAIVSRQIAPSFGFVGTQWVNAGQTSNWGTEVALSQQVIRPGGPLAWNVDLGFSHMGNRIDDLGLDVNFISPGYRVYHVEGFPIASPFSWEIVSAEWDGRGGVTNVQCLGPASLGPVRREDASPVPIAQGCAEIYQGGPTDPTWEANLFNDFTLFDDFRLTGTIRGRGGHVVLNRNTGPMVQCCPVSRLNWADDDPVVRAMGRYFRENVGHFDAGYVRLQDVALTYQAPETVARVVGASRASISVQMNNVWQIWREAWYSQVVYERGLEGPNRDAFYQPEPDIRDAGNFSVANYVQQPSKSVAITARFGF